MRGHNATTMHIHRVRTLSRSVLSHKQVVKKVIYLRIKLFDRVLSRTEGIYESALSL